MWYKINLTLFKTHISHKWDIITNLLEIFTNRNILGGYESGISNTGMGALLGQTYNFCFTHMQSLWMRLLP